MNVSYRLGTTSFIYPDHVAPNVERLAGRIEDVEILFFDVSRSEDLPDRASCQRLLDLKSLHGLSYTLHTPLDVRLASSHEPVRQESVQRVLQAMKYAQAFDPDGYVVHVETSENPSGGEALLRWQIQARRSIEELLAAGIPRDKLWVENLGYDLALLDPVIRELNLFLTLDIGHLFRDRKPVISTLEGYLPQVRMIHWHGVTSDGRDHKSIAHFPSSLGREVLAILDESRFDGILCLEVFNENEFESSMQTYQSLRLSLNNDTHTHADQSSPVH